MADPVDEYYLRCWISVLRMIFDLSSRIAMEPADTKATRLYSTNTKAIVTAISAAVRSALTLHDVGSADEPPRCNTKSGDLYMVHLLSEVCIYVQYQKWHTRELYMTHCPRCVFIWFRKWEYYGYGRGCDRPSESWLPSFFILRESFLHLLKHHMRIVVDLERTSHLNRTV
jgi:hypothetical protein